MGTGKPRHYEMKTRLPQIGVCGREFVSSTSASAPRNVGAPDARRAAQLGVTVRRLAVSAAETLDLAFRRADRIFRLAADEMESRAAVPFFHRMRGLLRGFLSQSLLLYPMTDKNRHLFVTDYQSSVRTPDINGVYRVLLKDKLLFDTMTQLFPALHIPTHGILDRGRLLYGNKAADRDVVDHVSELLETRAGLVLKPVIGGGGNGIAILKRQDNAFSINDSSVTPGDLRAWLNRRQRTLLCDYIVQAPELAALYPRTTNTVRLLTMWDGDEPFAASAVLRVGTSMSYPVDNGLMGGIAAGIDLRSGVVGRAVSFPRKSGKVHWYSTHPDTGEAIEGIVIPRWATLVEQMMEVCRHVPYLRYVGWDLVVTTDGFKLVEGNHFPGLSPNQAHGPLLADPRVMRFYKAYGVV